MHVAIALYPRFAALDVVAPYTALAFTSGYEITFVAARPGPVLDDRGNLSLTATAAFADVPSPDVLLVPGGHGVARAMAEPHLIRWIARAHQHTTWTTSVGTGSFLLGAAGLIAERRATTHWHVLDELAGLDALPVAERLVTDGKVMTAADFSAGIDMALTLLAGVGGDDTARAVRLALGLDHAQPRPSTPERPDLDHARALITYAALDGWPPAAPHD
ncbi:DJ-1/PfpI family protein [Nonomuraea sp. NPDC059023]|uniref:DJ-1/PfpI family protein n=1 Tax=unclassified Nonomuraea TaxID=2593643 RepID=UPI0036BEC1C0